MPVFEDAVGKWEHLDGVVAKDNVLKVLVHLILTLWHSLQRNLHQRNAFISILKRIQPRTRNLQLSILRLTLRINNKVHHLLLEWSIRHDDLLTDIGPLASTTHLKRWLALTIWTSERSM